MLGAHYLLHLANVKCVMREHALLHVMVRGEHGGRCRRHLVYRGGNSLHHVVRVEGGTRQGLVVIHGIHLMRMRVLHDGLCGLLRGVLRDECGMLHVVDMFCDFAALYLKLVFE